MLTPEDLARAMAMRAKQPPVPWRRIVKVLGCSMFALRAELDPEYLETSRAYSRKYRMTNYSAEKLKPKRVDNRDRSDRIRPKVSHRTDHHVVSERRIVPEAVEQERRHLVGYQPPTVTAAILGDPPPWRSALGKRQAGE